MLEGIEGFDHYGLVETNMLDKAWAEYVGAAWGSGGNTMELDTTRTRTGAASLKYQVDAVGGEFFGHGYWRRVMGEPKAERGLGFAIYMNELPQRAGRIGVQFVDATNTRQLGIYIMPTGAVQVYRGGVDTINGSIGTLIATSAIGLAAKGWQHFECYVKIHTTDGEVEVRCNGVTVLSAAGLNTQATALQEISQFRIGEVGNTTTQPIGMQADFWIDDLFYWNVEGSLNNSFIGDKKVYRLLPDADTATEEWTPNTGANSYENLNQVPPQDSTYFITTGTVGDVTIVGLEDLPIEVVSIAGVQLTPRAVKTDAGNAKIKVGLHSGSDVAEGDELPLSMAYQYFGTILETDPATGAPWTAAGLNAATASIERTE